MPNDADSPKFKTTVGSVKWVPENSEIVWSIKSFPVSAWWGTPSRIHSHPTCSPCPLQCCGLEAAGSSPYSPYPRASRQDMGPGFQPGLLGGSRGGGGWRAKEGKLEPSGKAEGGSALATFLSSIGHTPPSFPPSFFPPLILWVVFPFPGE